MKQLIVIAEKEELKVGLHQQDTIMYNKIFCYI